MINKLVRALILILVVGTISACANVEQNSAGYYLVDPRFSDLYQRLQGDEVLGPPISNKKYQAGTNLEKQYFEGVVMVYDPDQSPHYYLAPVGIEAGFSDLPNPEPENPNARYLNGYIIPLEFSQFYDSLGGERWVGLPLTRARFNPEKGRVEQYFENMGFFRFEGDPPGVVHLMPYGLWKCAGECSQYPGVQNAGISASAVEEVQSPFGEAIARFGTSFTGQAVSSAYRAEDGTIEQIFQNVVLYQDNSSPLGVGLRPISRLLSKSDGSYQARGDSSEYYFWEAEDGLGYYVPGYFLDFINQYFGFEVSGAPISKLVEIRDGVFEQCFENYCLLQDAAADPGQAVRILPQGQKYKDNFQRDVKTSREEPQVVRNIQLDIWEQLPQISSQEKQQIGACIHDGAAPLVNIPAEITLNFNGAGQYTYQFGPTDSGGCAFLELDPILAANGTTVDYEVCFVGLENDFCQRDSYLIWGNTTSDPPQEADPAPESVSEVEEQVVIDLWELHPQLSSTEFQEVGACFHLDQQPQSGLATQLYLETPHDGVISYEGSATDQGGCAFFKLDPVSANTGETIAYQVCFKNQYGEQVCSKDSFLIWGNP